MVTVPAALLDRIRGEFSEMPGLKLTFDQACRLWQLSADDCRAVLTALTAEGFLFKTSSGGYVARAVQETRPNPNAPQN